MSTAIIFGAPGSGKTVNSTLLPGKNLLLSSDNSAVVLKRFERPNLTTKVVTSFKEYIDENYEQELDLEFLSQKFGVSKSTVHKDISERLRFCSNSLYQQVQAVLQQHQ